MWSILRRPSRSDISGWVRLYVPAAPQQISLSSSGTSSRPGIIAEQLPGLRADLLAVAEVAGVVIGRPSSAAGASGAIGPSATRNSEMSLTLATNRAAASWSAAGQEVGVVLEHRAAAGGVDDDRVELVGVERREVLPGEVERRALDARVVVDRPAADLAARDDDLAAVLLEDPGGRGVGLGEHRVGHAAEEQGHPRPLRADRRQDLGQRPPGRPSVGSIACIRRRVGGRSRVRPTRSARSSTPELLEQPGRARARALTRPA